MIKHAATGVQSHATIGGTDACHDTGTVDIIVWPTTAFITDAVLLDLPHVARKSFVRFPYFR